MNRILLILLVGLWRLLMLLPRSFHLYLGWLLGFLFFKSSMKRNVYSKKNIDLCFPDLSDAERNQLHKSNILLSGRIPFDSGISWFWSDKRINRSISYKIKGLEKIKEEQENKNGVLLFFKHSLHLELDARLISMNSEMYGVERTHNSDSFNSIQASGRTMSMAGTCDRNNPIKFIRWLKKGKTVLYATDQDYGMSQSEIVNFFGAPCATISAPLKIIRSTNSKAYFLNTFFEDGVYVLDIEELDTSQTHDIDFSKYLNKFMENKIKKNPNEYLWQHRRFKSTLGKENFYG
ncbi:hypothetical protein N8150_00175 [Gammaproteobacteria bacterium]|nr:hypothetical protein [Gammaproteobacteria bacterium]